MDLLKNNPHAWKEDFGLKEMKTFVKNLNVVNDSRKGAKNNGRFQSIDNQK